MRSPLAIGENESYARRAKKGLSGRRMGGGRFIVIEGLDGAGKSSVARQLHDMLAQTYGERVSLTYQPHDASAAGAYIRDVLAMRERAGPLALALAFALNRADHLDRVVNPWLDENGGRTIVCDRYLLSSLVYQSTGCLSMDEIYELNRRARQPDLTVYLGVNPQNCYARLRNRPTDRELFERNLAERAEKYQAAMRMLRGKGERIIEVDANAPFPAVMTAVVGALRSHFPRLRVQAPLFVTTIDGAS